MFRVHAVDASNQATYASQLDRYYRLRHEIYVGERGWNALERPDGREIDRFDTKDATHLLGLTMTGNVVAGSRLIPSWKPHLMSEVFPRLVDGKPPRGDDVFEWTRVFVDRHLREPGRSCRAAGAIYCAMLEFSLQCGIRYLTVVCEDYWIARFQSMGWRPRRLGPPQESDGTTIVGLILEVTFQALATTRRSYRISRPILLPVEATGKTA